MANQSAKKELVVLATNKLGRAWQDYKKEARDQGYHPWDILEMGIVSMATVAASSTASPEMPSDIAEKVARMAMHRFQSTILQAMKFRDQFLETISTPEGRAEAERRTNEMFPGMLDDDKS